MPKASICIITARPGGIDAQLEYLGMQTERDFEVIIIDEYHEERKGQLRRIADKHRMTLKHHPGIQREGWHPPPHASNRNRSLLHAEGEIVIFLDDYQVVPQRWIEDHLKTTDQNTCCIGRQINLHAMDMMHPNWNDIKAKDERLAQLLLRPGMEYGGGWFYTSNASAPLKAILEVNGFDERFDGGSGGEDYDLGCRLERLGLSMVFNPQALVWHLDHDAVPTKWTRPECSMKHDVSPFVNNEYSRAGDIHLKETDSLTSWFEGDVKFWQCKTCGVKGVTDSLMIFKSNTKHEVIRAPNDYDLRDRWNDMVAGRI